MDDGEICVTIAKSEPGVTWESALKGHATLNTKEFNDAKKAMLLERFQKEHPGFDFSNANVTGNVPNANTFLDGINPEALTK